MKYGIWLFLFVVSACSQKAEQTDLDGNVPNIILIVADDLGVGDLGYLGGEMETPHLDNLASQGIRFNRFYSWALCSPARAALITGQDPMQMDMAWNPLRPEDTRGLPVDIPTIAEIVKENSYQTACIGKWHLGHAKQEMHPNQRGFDYFYGCLQGAIDYESHLDRNQKLDWQRNGEAIEESGYATRLFAEDAANWIKKVSANESPFFLYLPFTAPHLPLQAPIKTNRKYLSIEDTARRVYCAMTDELDQGVGKIIASLKESGEYENTLIVFLSDNGAGKEDGGSNLGLRGAKGSAFEGGIRVPAFLWWPAKFKPRIESNPFSISDIAPSIADAAGIKNFSGLGVSVFNGKPSKREFKFASRNQGWTNYALVDGSTKFVLREKNDGSLIRERVFDLSIDPYEENDLSKVRQEDVAHYRDILRNWSR